MHQQLIISVVDLVMDSSPDPVDRLFLYTQCTSLVGATLHLLRHIHNRTSRITMTITKKIGRTPSATESDITTVLLLDSETPADKWNNQESTSITHSHTARQILY